MFGLLHFARKKTLGKVSVTMNDGSIINGYCENLFKHEHPVIKV